MSTNEDLKDEDFRLLHCQKCHAAGRDWQGLDVLFHVDDPERLGAFCRGCATHVVDLAFGPGVTPSLDCQDPDHGDENV